MTDTEKLDHIIKLLRLQRKQDMKWKPLTDYLENTGRNPEQIIEAFIGIDKLYKERRERFEREGKIDPL